MSNKVEVVCFTDLKDSTGLFERLGHNAFLPHLEAHLSAGKCLAEATRGHYVKNVGDAHLIEWDSPEDALRFALYLQQLYKHAPCCGSNPQLAVKIGLFLGVAYSTGSDVFGSAVNQAARVQGQAQPGEVLVNDAMYTAMKRIWDSKSADAYFASAGKHELRGITDPAEQELFHFDWDGYGRDNPERGLAGLVYDHLQRAKVEPSNLECRDLVTPGTVIWPVVPRQLVTAIHRGQAEIIRLLAMLGWSVQLLIADCSAQDSPSRSESAAFQQVLVEYLKKRGVDSITATLLSDLYNPSFEGYDKVQDVFRRIASHLTLQDLLDINHKKYNAQVQEEISRSATLDCLRPALSLAAVIHMASASDHKCVVVAGLDERIQWVGTHSIPGTQDLLGVLMNPVLNDDPTHQTRQKGVWPSWTSWHEIVRAMDGSNLAWWVFLMHVYLPAFPNRTVTIGRQKLAPDKWNDQMAVPARLNKDELAQCAWQILNPSL